MEISFRLQILLTATLSALCLSSKSHGVELDANVLGIYTDTTFSQPVSDFWISADGDQAVSPLQPGQGVLIGIDVANFLDGQAPQIFASLRVDSTQLTFQNGTSIPQVLLELGFGGDWLHPVAPIDIKINSPGGTDEWIQVMLHSTGWYAGSFETGPDINAIQVYFEVPASSAPGAIVFALDLTEGDVISSSTGPWPSGIFDDAVLVVPEPAFPIEIAMGVATLVFMGRRFATVRN